MDLNELSKNPDQIRTLIDLLQNLLPDTSNKKSDHSNDDQFTNPIKTKTGKNNFAKKRPNVFEEMLEKNMHQDDIEVDKKLSVHPPVARSRDFQTIRVKCRVCGKEEDVSPSITSNEKSRYKCNNCSLSAG